MGLSRGQLAEIWAASRHCRGSLKSREFPAASPRRTIHLPRRALGTGGAGAERRVLFIQTAGLGHQPALCVCIPINSRHHRSRLECRQSDKRQGAADAAITLSPVPGVAPRNYPSLGCALHFFAYANQRRR